ncbi:DNA-directed RNA polymerase II core subunit rpb9 [Elasticomyces elasticus]|nr:DNA-directed RNA polymerase II core subunit rpb9 [Elasticomyces elasticus]
MSEMGDYASPGGDDNADTKSGKIAFRFCRECSNMLYPREDDDARKLMFQCRTCNYSEDAAANCVYRNDIAVNAGEIAGVTQDVASDPTVGDLSFPAICTLCGEAIRCEKCKEVLDDMLDFVVEESGLQRNEKGDTSNQKAEEQYDPMDLDELVQEQKQKKPKK